MRAYATGGHPKELPARGVPRRVPSPRLSREGDFSSSRDWDRVVQLDPYARRQLPSGYELPSFRRSPDRRPEFDDRPDRLLPEQRRVLAPWHPHLGPGPREMDHEGLLRSRSLERAEWAPHWAADRFAASAALAIKLNVTVGQICV